MAPQQHQSDLTFKRAAFVLLAAITAAHMLLETARDSLFLTRIPARWLPLVYLAVVAVALVGNRLQGKLKPRRGECSTLGSLVLLAGLLTALLWLALPVLGESGVITLYVWSGAVTALVLVYFWNLVADRFQPEEARLVFARIALGALVGAIIGTGLSTLLLLVIAPAHLVLVAAFLMVVPAFVAVPKLHTDCAKLAPDEACSVSSPTADSALSGRRRAVMRLASVVVLSSMALTLADFVFKFQVAERVAPDELPMFIARLYLALNVGAFLVQLLIVPTLSRRFEGSTVATVLPFVLLGAATSVAVGAALFTASLLKASDGLFRHSLHRTSIELMYTDLPRAVRHRVKAAIEVAGQKGGQALMSVTILGATALGAGLPHLLVILSVIIVGWISAVWAGARRPTLAAREEQMMAPH